MRRARALALAALCALGPFAAGARAADTIATGMIGKANAAGWPWYVGLAKGYFAQAGIALDMIYVSTASGLVQQLAAGSLDIVGEIGVVEPIHAVHRGAPVAILRVIGRVSPYEMVAKPAIATVKDLKGKIVCIGGLLDINRVYLERIMQANGLHDGDYDITVVGNTAGRFAALKSGSVDATMLAPPVSFFAEAAGFRNIGMMVDYAGDMPFSSLDVALPWAHKHADTARRLIAALDESVAWFDDDKNRGAAIDILAAEMKSDRAPVAKSYDYLRRIDYFARDNRVSRRRLEAVVAAMKRLGDVAGDVAVDRLVIPELTRLVD